MTTFSFLVIISLFTLIMVIVSLRQKHDNTLDTFFAAGRNVGIFAVAISTAASWQWADNFFSTAQIGFDYGIYGIIWFTLMTSLSFIIFAFIAERIRSQAPKALTIPEFVSLKTDQSKSVHISMVIAITLYQLFALALGATATGFLLSSAFGFDYVLSAASAIVFALAYSLISGLKASVVTDVVQFVMMFALMIFIIATIAMGIEPEHITKEVIFGSNQTFTSFFNNDLMIELGIPLAIILLTQPIVDQMIFQRLVAFKQGAHPIKPFILTSVICGLIILIFSCVGIFGQILAQQGLITITDSQFTVIEVVRYSLSDFGLMLFVLAFIGVVFSTTDSVYSSVASLISIDIYKRYFAKNKSEKDIIKVGRISMIVVAILAIAISLAKLEILWMLFIIGAAGGTIVMPVVFSVYAKALSPKMVVASILVALIVSVPLSIYGNLVENALLVSAGSLAGIAIGTVFCSFAVIKKV